MSLTDKKITDVFKLLVFVQLYQQKKKKKKKKKDKTFQEKN